MLFMKADLGASRGFILIFVYVKYALLISLSILRKGYEYLGVRHVEVTKVHTYPSFSRGFFNHHIVGHPRDIFDIKYKAHLL